MNEKTWHLISHLFLRNLAILVIDLVLLVISIWVAFLPMDNWNTGVNMLIAFIMGMIGLLFFMGLVEKDVLFRLAVAGGIYFIVVLFVFTLSDYFTRLT